MDKDVEEEFDPEMIALAKEMIQIDIDSDIIATITNLPEYIIESMRD